MEKGKNPQTMYNGLRVLAFAMQKGGVGKTTLCIHTAVRAALGLIPEVKKKILVIDVDQQQNLSKTLLDMEPVEEEGYCIPPIHPCFDPNDPEDADWDGRSNSLDLYYGNGVTPYPSKISDRIDVLPSDGAVLLDFDDYKTTSDENLLEAIYNQMFNFFSLEEVQDEYDLVIYDCPPGKSLITTPVLRAITDLILPTDAASYGIDGVHRLIYEINKENNFRFCNVNILGIIPNKCDPRKNNLEIAALRALRKNSITAKHVMPFNMYSRSAMRFESLPTNVINDPVIQDKKTENQIINFIGYIRHKMFGADFNEIKGE